uniref:Cytochrome P450 monooxygenase n=1 Tax=Meloidogyne floridensis TaxID=298350 RepID=A0A915PBF1_9BILA
MKLTKKFGRLFLTIEIGPGMKLRKNYICSDPNLLEELFNTKQFENFSERNSVNYVRPDVAHLFLANGERWANLRKSASIFTSKNIRSMNKLIEDSIIDVLNEMKIGAKKCEIIDFCDYADLFFAAMISRMAFSLIFPNVDLIEFPQKYVNFAKDLIIKKEQHKENEQKQKQFGLFKVLYNHILIDKQDSSNESSSNNSTTRLEVILGKLLLNNSVKAAGLQTISFALSCIVHFMANHLQVQENLRSELISLQKEDNNLLLNNSSEKALIDGVINETLRLCPVVALWFNSPHSPSSFLALIPFGFGPRRCVGIPLAKHILKKTLTAIILKFRIIYENACEIELMGKEVLKPRNVLVRIKEVKDSIDEE